MRACCRGTMPGGCGQEGECGSDVSPKEQDGRGSDKIRQVSGGASQKECMTAIPAWKACFKKAVVSDFPLHKSTKTCT